MKPNDSEISSSFDFALQKQQFKSNNFKACNFKF